MLLALYQLLFPLIGLSVLARLLIGGRGRILAEDRAQLRQRLGLLSPDQSRRLAPTRDPPGRTLWVHAASVGEIQAAAPLLQALNRREAPPRILVTTSTAAGLRRARDLPGVALAVLAPMDFYPCVCAFLDRSRPDALLLLETELWPATLRAALNRGLGVSIANGRITRKSFRFYQLARPLLAPLLAGVRRAALQTEEDARRFLALGLRPEASSVTGNIKFDSAPSDPSSVSDARRCFHALGWKDRPVWVAGCTWPGEEEAAVLDAYGDLLRKHPSLRLVLAPRHCERSQETASALESRGLSFRALSSLRGQPVAAPPRVLLADRMGALRGFYAAGDVAFVGGTLIPVGGHNLLEPAIDSRPVLFGPHTDSARESAAALEESGGGIRVEDARSLLENIDRLLSDASILKQAGLKARETAERLSGATRRTLDFLAPVFSG